MTLPATFSSPIDYFRASIDFLHAHSWIYQTANTRFVKAGILEKFPKDYIEYFLHLKNNDLNKFPFLYECDDFNYGVNSFALRTFRSTLRKLIPKEAYDQPNVQSPTKSLTINRLRRISVKKQHEIIQLSEVIVNHCADVSLLLDFGSGLGYLSESLCCTNANWSILGLEADSSRVVGAHKRLQAIMPEANKRVTYKQQFIEADASEDIKHHIACSGFENTQVLFGKWAIIGLHACADLTVTAIKLFFELSAVKCLVIMPCCYHKLQQTSNGNFLNFPLSAALKAAVAEKDSNMQSYFNRPFLRLACQETSARWRTCSDEEHLAHGKQMFWRAVADAVVGDYSGRIATVVKSQQCVHNLCEIESFADFCQHYKQRSKKTDAQHLSVGLWNDEHKEKFNKIFNNYADVGPKLAEALTCLQTTLQKLCENIVLYDQLCYMQEFADAQADLKLNVRFQKILDEKLSPRCYVLIAEKL